MKNKIAAILLTGAMTAALLAGCGNTAADTENLMESTEAATEAVLEEAAEKATEEVEEEVTEVLEETEAPAVVQTTMYAQQKVNVRSLPSTDGEILGSLSANDPVIVVGDASEDGWYTVTYCEQTAYVKENYLGTEKVEIKTSSSSGKQGTSSASNSSTANSTNTEESTGANSGSDNGGSQEAASQPAEQPAAAPAEQPAPAPTAETPAPAPEQSAPAEQPATGSMDGANATMSEATGQQGHWESHYNPDLGNDVMVWVVD